MTNWIFDSRILLQNALICSTEYRIRYKSKLVVSNHD